MEFYRKSMKNHSYFVYQNLTKNVFVMGLRRNFKNILMVKINNGFICHDSIIYSIESFFSSTLKNYYILAWNSFGTQLKVISLSTTNNVHILS